MADQIQPQPSFSFLVCKMGIVIVPTSQGCMRIPPADVHKALRSAPGIQGMFLLLLRSIRVAFLKKKTARIKSAFK